MLFSKLFIPTLLATVSPSRAQIYDGWGGWFLSCGATITSSTKLREDYVCDCSINPAFTLEGNGITLDLNGHFVSCGITLVKYRVTDIGIYVNGKGNKIVGPGNVTEANIGILLDGEGGHSVLHSTSLYDTGFMGVLIQSDSNIVDSCIVEKAILFDEDLRRGVFVEIGFKYNIIENNKFINIRNGIIIFGSRNRAASNYIEAGNYGVYMSFGDMNEILKNTISSQSIAVFVDGSGSGHIIKSNEIFESGLEFQDNSFYPTLWARDVSNLQVEDNHIYKSCCPAYFFRVSDSIIKNNIVEVTSLNQDAIVSDSSTRNFYIGNTADGGDNFFYCGLFVVFSAGEVVIDNIFTRGGFGLWLENAANTVVSRNTMWGYSFDYIDNGIDTIFAGDNGFQSSAPLDETSRNFEYVTVETQTDGIPSAYIMMQEKKENV